MPRMAEPTEPPRTPADDQELDEGPYGLRGAHTPPLQSMIGGYGIIFVAAIVVPLILFVLIRFVIL